MSEESTPQVTPVGSITISLLPRDIKITITGKIEPLHLIAIRGQLAKAAAMHLASQAKTLPPTTPPTQEELGSVGTRKANVVTQPVVKKEIADAKA